MGKTTGWQYSVRAHAVVTRTERCIAANQNLASVLELRQERKWLVYLHFQVFWGIFVDKINGFIHRGRQHNTASPHCFLKNGATKCLSPFWQCRYFIRQQRQHRLNQWSAICDKQAGRIRRSEEHT